ncbi:MAG: NYN domain-containing protein [Candidatus Aminicenantes bacterium]|nr:NYN domain-containing protein [Candidatus Aminicenantes bacterium]
MSQDTADTKRILRVNAFFDAQNLFNSAKRCFGYKFPNYDPVRLAKEINTLRAADTNENREINRINFYTGYPPKDKNEGIYGFWQNKLNELRRQGVRVKARKLVYREELFEFDNVTILIKDFPIEKGIDLCLGIEIVLQFINNDYDVALIFSQDLDLTEAVDAVHALSKENGRWAGLECAYPYSEEYRGTRGIDRTVWLKIPKDLYDRCIDPKDYRPSRGR